MVFSSLLFLYAFFPLSLLAYVLVPGKQAKNVVLLVFSLIFYAWGEPVYVLLLMFMALVSWFCALRVQSGAEGKRKLWLILSCVVDIVLIGYFKYAGLICSVFGTVPEAVKSIALPIGISFYTFQLLTYVVDVYRADAKAQKSYWNVLLYAALFHQCIAGPIVRYKTIDEDLFSDRPRQPEVARGVSRFAAGLAKKVLLANPCGALADSILLSTATLADPSLFTDNLEILSGLPAAQAWLGMIAYSLQIYLDFSAYSDMAIGMGNMLGLRYLENFDYPYISRSITEFWRRWHMSLGTFFRDYVYIPLGGSRCSFGRATLNTLAVWLLTGLWHGASWNFVLWGLWYFVFLMIERLFLKKRLEKLPAFSNLYVLAVVIVGWVIFRFADLRLMMAVLGSMFCANGNVFTDFSTRIVFQSNSIILAVSCFACLPVTHRLGQKLLAKESRLWDVLLCSLLPVVLLLLSTMALVGDSYNPFIYFQF